MYEAFTIPRITIIFLELDGIKWVQTFFPVFQMKLILLYTQTLICFSIILILFKLQCTVWIILVTTKMYITLFYKSRVEKDVHVDKRIAIRFRWCSFITYCIGIFANTDVSRSPAPCPPHGHREGQTTLTLHRIARSTAPQFAAWSKIEIKDRGVYRFTLVLALIELAFIPIGLV